MLPPNFLGVNRSIGSAGQLNPADQVYVNILDTEGGRPNSAGIVVISALPGMVAPYEEHSARRKAGYSLPAWRELDWIERAIEVAMLRLENKIEAIISEDEMDRQRHTRPRGK